MLNSSSITPLKAALREARLEEGYRQDSIYAIRDVEYTRLHILFERLDALFTEIPSHIDLFDLGLKPSEKPRLWIDMVSFVEMAEDRRLYRFYQDTRAGRVLLFQDFDMEEVAKDVLAYVARRLIAREQLLAMPMAEPKNYKPATVVPEDEEEKHSEPETKVDFFTAAKMAAREEALQGEPPFQKVTPPKKKHGFRRLFVAFLFAIVILATFGMAASKLLQLF
jgi:hypothetical protein